MVMMHFLMVYFEVTYPDEPCNAIATIIKTAPLEALEKSSWFCRSLVPTRLLAGESSRAGYGPRGRFVGVTLVD